MGKHCLLCSEKSSVGSKISFHKFPKKNPLRMQWFNILSMVPFPTNYKYVCSRHFADDSFRITPTGIRYLKKTAVPSLKLDDLFQHNTTTDDEMVFCGVPGCNSSSNPRSNVTFHCFPADPELCQKWVTATKRRSKPTKSSKICSLHFRRCDLGQNCFGNKIVKLHAVPTLNLPSSESVESQPILPKLSVKSNAELYSNVPASSSTNQNFQTILLPGPSCSTNVNSNDQLVMDSRTFYIPATNSNNLPPNEQSPQQLKFVSFQRLAPLNMRISNQSLENVNQHVLLAQKQTENVQQRATFVTEPEPIELDSDTEPEEEQLPEDVQQTAEPEHIELDSETDTDEDVQQITTPPTEPGHLGFDSETEIDGEEPTSAVSEQMQAPILYRPNRSILRPRIIPAYVGDVREEDLEDPVARKRAWRIATENIAKYRKKIKVLQLKLSRMEKKNKMLNDVICTLMNDHLGVKTLYIDNSG